MLGMLQIIVYALAGIIVVGGMTAWLLDVRLTSLTRANRSAWVGFVIFLLSLGLSYSLVRTADTFAAKLSQSVEDDEEDVAYIQSPWEAQMRAEQMERWRRESEMRRREIEALRQQVLQELEYQVAQDLAWANRLSR